MSSLTPKEKLKALGVSAPAVQNNPFLTEFGAIEDYGFSQFVTDVQGQASFAEFETYLQNTVGLSASDAEQFRKRMEQKYASFSDFQNALSGFSNEDEWINSFSWGTTIAGDTTEADGQTLGGGIRVHAEAGVSYDGVSVPAGSVEIFGSEIHTSQSGASSTKQSAFTTTNLTISDTTPDLFEEITIGADVTNNNGYNDRATAKLIEDGEVVDSKSFLVGANSTRSISFTRQYTELVSVEVRINDTPTQDVIVVPTGLVEPEDL